jgi:hypothetical protein
MDVMVASRTGMATIMMAWIAARELRRRGGTNAQVSSSNSPDQNRHAVTPIAMQRPWRQ